MRVAIVGYGRMGREVEAVLREQGHEALLVRRGDAFPGSCSVGIDFSRGDAVLAHVERALASGARYVVGTTGWSGQLDQVRNLVEAANGGLVHAANFSIGVNLFYGIVRAAAALLAPFPAYDAYVLDQHHRDKKDAPSGTARVLLDLLAEAYARPAASFPAASLRAGGIVGEHTVGFDSGGDELRIEHRARSRRGFAEGAVLAAEWIAARTGCFGFEAVLRDVSARGAL